MFIELSLSVGLQSSRIRAHPTHPGVPGSGRTATGSPGYFGVFLGYEVSRLRSSPAFNFVTMSFYDHFCFLQNIRSQAFISLRQLERSPPFDRALAPLMRLQKYAIFMRRTLPTTVVTLLQRTGSALALLSCCIRSSHSPTSDGQNIINLFLFFWRWQHLSNKSVFV